MRCQLCGFDYDLSQASCHPACPLHSRCTLVCCPNCGYQEVDAGKSRIAGWLARWWKPRAQPSTAAPGQPCPLAELPLGTEAEIESMDGLEPARRTRLSIYGLAPGCRVCLLQRHPACVVRAGETELALSREIVAQIQVRMASRAEARD
jgi:Fe2+ transport system protein FeoA